jgi:type I restriction enzyme, R subunit
MSYLNEDTIEQAALELLREVGYSYVHGGEIAPGEPHAERSSYGDVLLVERLRASLHRINDHIPAAVRAQVIAEALPRLTRATSQSLLLNNYEFHKLLTEGVDVSYRDTQQRHAKLWLIASEPERLHLNDWLAVNQFTVEDVNPLTRTRTNRRPDIVLFVNGLPLVVIELKNAADEDANLEAAYHQLQTYKDEISPLFVCNVLLAISDGTYARLGTLTSGWEYFKPWRTIDGTVLPKGTPELEPLIKGVFAPDRLLDILRYFIVFERDEAKLVKKVAAYHQYHAVNKALASTLEATSAQGDKRVGVVWHTQGSGKSLSMLFYAGKIIQQPQMQNPTLVILTDRNDLDDQLFGTFASGQELLRQTPVQAQDRSHLRELLRVAAGGVVFTTIQKFMPEDGREYPLLSERRNIVFIADEAHRSQYGFEARLIQRADYAAVGYGFAKYVRDALPNASFIGFTGTPVETTDANTRQVFGDYIDIYDIQRAVDDGATVPIYYEARLATLRLREDQRPQIDPAFEEVTEGEEDYVKDKLRTKWAQLEAAVGSDERLAQIAQDIITHFEQRLDVLDGKGMIVCMSRRIAVDLYNQFIQLRPQWHSADDTTGTLKVIMTGSASDPAHYQPHVRNKPRRKAIAERFKDPTDPLKLVIVRDMWLTGFDVPPLHTMYLDKPMYGHGLMQAIARVNRVFKDKPGGLVVDYLGIAPELREAVQQYTLAGSGRPAVDVDEAVQILLTDHDVVKNFFRRFDYSAFFRGTPLQRLRVIPAAMEHVLEQPDGKKRYLDAVTRLTKAFALSVPDARALALRDDVAFFQAVRAAIAKISTPEGKSEDDLNNAVKQIVSKAIASENIVNILDAAGIKSPDISILSDEFLDDLKHLPQKNVALELLRKLIADEVKARSRQNVVQARSFSEMLDQTIRRYQNRAVDAAQIITELIDIAKEIRQAQQRGDALGLGEDELAFYDALANNISARDVLGDKQLAVIAVELLKSVRQSVTIDWAVKQSARAKIRVLVKRILKQYGYPPDLQEAATNLVLEQAELLAAQWVG